jgi:hypothetical protein
MPGYIFGDPVFSSYDENSDSIPGTSERMIPACGIEECNLCAQIPYAQHIDNLRDQAQVALEEERRDEQRTGYTCAGCDYTTTWPENICSDCGNGYCPNCCECIESSSYRERDDYDNGLRDYDADVIECTNASINHRIRNFGIELEFEVDNNVGYVREKIDRYPLNEKWIAKSDGSLSDGGGVECVSIPMPYEEMRSSIEEFFRLTNISDFAERNSDCGTHIHVSRNSVNARTIARVWAFFHRAHYNRRMENLLVALVGRPSNDFAYWSDAAPVAFSDFKDDSDRSPRYSSSFGRTYRQGQPRINGHYAAISCSARHSTYEFRVFAGCTRASRALRCLEVCDMLLNIAEETHGREILTNDIALLHEIGIRLDQYPNLLKSFQDSRSKLYPYWPLVKPLVKSVQPWKRELSDEQLAKRAKRLERKSRVGRDIPPDITNRFNKPKIHKTTLTSALRRFDYEAYLRKNREKSEGNLV